MSKNRKSDKWYWRLQDLIYCTSRCPRKRDGWNHKNSEEEPHDWRIFDGPIMLIRQWRINDGRKSIWCKLFGHAIRRRGDTYACMRCPTIWSAE